MTDDQHRVVAGVLHRVSGLVVLSGRPCDLYDVELYPDWERRTFEHLDDGARKRTEALWLNPACVAALESERHQGELRGFLTAETDLENPVEIGADSGRVPSEMLRNVAQQRD